MLPATALLVLAQAAPAPQSVTVPFLYHERVVFLELRANDSPGRLFLLDTGASASAVDARLAEELALPREAPTRVEGTAGTVEVARGRLDTLALEGLAVTALHVTVQDLTGSLCPEGRRLDGILGHDFLQGFTLELDFPARRLVLTRGSPGAAPPEAIPIELDNGIPRLRARLDDLELWLRLDTGASLFETRDVYVNVPEPVWQELRRADPGLEPEGALGGGGTGGALTLPFARVQALEVGPHRIERPFVIVQPARGYFARPEAVGFLGNNFLERFGRVRLDYPARHLWLGPLSSTR